MLGGCSLFSQLPAEKVEIPVPSDYALTPASQPDPIESKEVEFNVISKQDFMKAAIEKGLTLEQAAELAKTVFENEVSLFTLSGKYYGNLGENMQEIIRYIREQRKVIQYYRDNVPEPKAVEPKKDAKDKD